MCPQSSQAASQIYCSNPMVAEDDLDFWDFDFAMMMSFCKIMIDYIIKKAFLLENILVIVTEDGIFLWCFCEATTLPNIARPGNVQQ